MDLKEAYKQFDLTEQEKESLQRYMGFRHASINVLADMSSRSFFKLKDTGWFISTEAKDVKQDIEDFVNIYSIMLKTADKSNPPRRLVRGTSNGRMRSIGSELHQMLSTSRSEEVAKRFTEYGDSAIARVKLAPGSLYLDTSAFRDENRADEEEVIIAPFSKTKSRLMSGDKKSTSYYDVEVEAPDLSNVPEMNFDALMKEVLDGYKDNIEEMRILSGYEARVDALDERYRNSYNNRALQSDIVNERHQLYGKMSEPYNKTKDFGEKIRTLLKGLCKEKERSLEEARRVIDYSREQLKIEQENIRKEQERQREKKEQERQNEEKNQIIRSLRGKVEVAPSSMEALYKNVSTTYHGLEEVESQLKRSSDYLGLRPIGLLPQSLIKRQVSRISSHLSNMRTEFDTLNFDANGSLEDAKQIDEYISPLIYGLESSTDKSQSLYNAPNRYAQELEKEMKKELYVKVQDVIKRAKLQKLYAERSQVADEKIGFFGRLFGKQKLQNERLNTIGLKIKLEESKVVMVPENVSVRDMLADMVICQEMDLAGFRSPEIADMSERIKNVYHMGRSGRISDEYIRQKAMEKMRSRNDLPISTDEIIQSGTTSGKIEKLKKENQRLISMINYNRDLRSRYGTNVVRKPIRFDSVNEYSKVLTEIENATRTRLDRQQEHTVNMTHDYNTYDYDFDSRR